MPLDPSILQGIKPMQIESPVNALGNILQVQGAQQANRLRGMQMDGMKRSQADADQMRELARQAGGDSNKLVELLNGAGRFEASQSVQKGMADLDKTKTETGYKKAQTNKEDYALGAQKREQSMRDIVAFATPQDAIANVQKHLLDGDITPEQGQMMIKSIPQDPAQFPAWKLKILTSLMTPKEQVAQVSPDANARLSAQTSRANNTASVGAQMANAGATREVAKATRDAGYAQRDMNTEMKLSDDYRAQSKGFKDVGDAYRTISATLDKATTSPAATLAGATKFMKLLDPGSVVRESELGMALAASGVFDRAANYFNTLQKGKVLTTNQVVDFKKITEQIYSAAKEGQKQVDADYTNKAKAYNLRPENIVQDFGQSAGVDSGEYPADIKDLLNKHGK